MEKEMGVRLKISGRILPLRGNDIDTDRIIPARFLRCVTFDDLGDKVFFDERFSEDGVLKNHPFDLEQHRGASVLVVGANFGCGSSREHAPQALMRFGISAIIGQSFAEIFAGNCLSLGIPVFTASSDTIETLQKLAEKSPANSYEIDIAESAISGSSRRFDLSMSNSAQESLLQGSWDTLDVLLRNSAEIEKLHSVLPY